MRPSRSLALAALAVALLGGCRQDMHDQPVVEAYEASDFFADGRGDRAPVEGTVARGQLFADTAFYTGLDGDAFVAELPIETTVELLERGRERYDIFCSPCHDRLGDGRGMIVRRGFKQPASFHETRLRDQPVGYYYDVISRGFGEMSSYASMIDPHDRWAISAYIRVLQLSQRVVLADLDTAQREQIERAISDEGAEPATSSANSEETGH